MARTRAKKKVEEEEDKKPSELESLLKDVEKAHGKGVMVYGTQAANFTHSETGIFMLDFALLGGLAEGFASMMYGKESSGKSTLALRAVASKLRKYPESVAIWVDSETTFDIGWAEKHGIDPRRIIRVAPDSGEQAVDIIDEALQTAEVSIVVLDSVPATVPQKIIDNSASDLTMGKLAQLMGILCSKISIAWNKERKRNHYVDVIFINQFREKLGVMFGDTRSTPGGKQLNYLVTTKLELKSKEILGKDDFENEVVERNTHTFKVTKAKIGASVRNGEFDMVVDPSHELGQGAIDDYKTVCTYAKKMGFIRGGGASWRITFLEEKFKKLDEIRNYLIGNPDDYLRLKQYLIATQRISKGLPPVPRDGYLLGYIEEEEVLNAIEASQE
jgi:recombination protein RecA